MKNTQNLFGDTGRDWASIFDFAIAILRCASDCGERKRKSLRFAFAWVERWAIVMESKKPTVASVRLI
jgi:hypothetical protein